VRNRGYKFIINRNECGYWMLCINPTWINDMLRSNGIDPKLFRSISWQEIASVTKDRYAKELFVKLQPANFWQMCDVYALSMSEYTYDFETPIYNQSWFSTYPIFTAEDVYELLRDDGMEQEEALRVTEAVRKGKTSIQGISILEYLELYDVDDRLIDAICQCEFLADRQEAIAGLVDTAKKILDIKEQMRNNPFC